jgi:hypothetical protein
MAIQSYVCADTEKLYRTRKPVAKFGAIQKVAMRKLAMMD